MDWPAFGVFSTGDRYVRMAMHVCKTMSRQRLSVPKDDNGLDDICDKVLRTFDFANCQHRIPHTKAFIREVIRDTSCSG